MVDRERILLGKYDRVLQGGKVMSATVKPYTIEELMQEMFEDNYSHLELIDSMGGDCDCNIHTTMNTVMKYWGE
jgi:hypothetical protein